jgi:hypothetical protein
MFSEFIKLEHKVIADYFRRTNGKTEDMPYRNQFLNVVESAVKLRFDKPLEGYRDWATVWHEGEHYVPYNDPSVHVFGAYYAYADEHSCCVTFDGKRVSPLTGELHLWTPETSCDTERQGPQPEGRERVAIHFTLSS